jgi:phosphoribosyl-ATP pyrophosphohydrolase
LADYNLEKLFDDLLKKKKFDKENSYTSILLKNKNLLAKKIGEESIEVVLEYLDNNKDKITRESADLLYHLCVIWISADIKPGDVWRELHRRRGISGLEEKKSRVT